MFKKYQEKPEHIKGLVQQCDLLEKEIETNVNEILRLVESITEDIDEEISLELMSQEKAKDEATGQTVS